MVITSPYEAADVLLKYVYSGVLGPTKGLAVDYALMRTTDDAFIYSVTLEPLDGPEQPLDRYQIELDKHSGTCSVPKKIEITFDEMCQALLAATNETVTSSQRFKDGGLSISYKVITKQKPNDPYIVQLRHHGQVASMDALMMFVSANTEPGAIPMPSVYPIPHEAEHQRLTGFGRQITQFIPGVGVETAYQEISHANRLELVRKVARAWQACWDLPLPSPRWIGELIATKNNGDISLAVGPDRHYSLGGPFTSVRDWLRGRLQHALGSLERQSGIDEFKEDYLARITSFINHRLDQMPKSIDECPIVALHVDLGLHNIIVSADDHTQINAIIDWEFTASGPFQAAYDCMEMLFRPGSPSGYGPEYPLADELREAFWTAIPKWKKQWESQSAQDFLEWYRFSLFMKPEYCSKELSKAEKMDVWAENVRVVNNMLDKYA